MLFSGKAWRLAFFVSAADGRPVCATPFGVVFLCIFINGTQAFSEI